MINLGHECGTVKISTELDKSGVQSGLDKIDSLASKGLKGAKVTAEAAGRP